MASGKEYKLAIKIMGEIDKSLGNSFMMTKKQMRDLARSAAEASTGTTSFTDAMAAAGPGIDAAWGGVTAAAKMGVAAMTAAGAVAVTVGKQAVDTGSEFEKAMSSWAATAGATDEDYKRVEAESRKWGAMTTKTATEAANAMEYMALAGWSVDDSIKGLPGVLKLSEAGGMDLARASDLVTDSMSAAGVSVDDLTGYLNVAAMANNKSNQTAEQMMEAMIGVGGAMKDLRVPIEETSTALGVMANRGIKGSEAGTALNAIMTNLTSGMGQAGDKLEEIGVSAFDSNHNFKGLTTVLNELNAALSTMNEEERNAATAMIGGKNHRDALNALLGGMNNEVAEGVTEWDALYGSLTDADGALERMAATKMDNLWGDLQILNSAMDDAKIHIYEGLKDPLRDVVQEMTGMVTASGGMIDTLNNSYPTLKRYAKDGIGAVGEMAQPLLSAGKWLAANPEAFSPVIGVVTAIGALKAVKTGTDLLTGPGSIISLITALASNPATAAIGALAGLAGGITAVYSAVKIHEDKMARRSLAEHFGDMTLSLEELQEVSQQIIGKDTMGRLAMSMQQLDKVKTIGDGIRNTAGEIEKLNWKVSMGFDLTEGENSDLKIAIDKMIADSQEYIREKQVSVNMSVGNILGEDTDVGSEMIANLNVMYGSMQGEVAALGTRLGKAYSNAMADGMIDIDEIKTIQELTDKLNEITGRAAEAKAEADRHALERKYGGRKLTVDSFQNLVSELNANSETAKESINADYLNALEAENVRYAQIIENRKNMDAHVRELTEASVQQTHERNIAALDSGERNKRAEVAANAASFSLGSVRASFETEINQYLENFRSTLEEGFSGVLSGVTPMDMLLQQTTANGADANAVGKMLEQMQPQIEDIKALAEEYKAAGEEIPQALAEALNDATALEAMTGSGDAMYALLGQSILESESLTAAVEAAEQNGQKIPETISEAIKTASETQAPEAARSSGDSFQSAISSEFAGRTFEATANVRVNPGNIDTSAVSAKIRQSLNTEPYSGSGYRTPRAYGGFFSSETDVTLAEAGDNEYAIPVNNTLRAATLWQEAGKQLAAAGAPVGGGGGVVYSPSQVFNIAHGDEATVRRAMQASYKDFARQMQDYLKQQYRTSV